MHELDIFFCQCGVIFIRNNFLSLSIKYCRKNFVTLCIEITCTLFAVVNGLFIW